MRDMPAAPKTVEEYYRDYPEVAKGATWFRGVLGLPEEARMLIFRAVYVAYLDHGRDGARMLEYLMGMLEKAQMMENVGKGVKANGKGGRGRISGLDMGKDKALGAIFGEGGDEKGSKEG